MMMSLVEVIAGLVGTIFIGLATQFPEVIILKTEL